MTVNCPTCNTELPSDHPAVTLDKLLIWVDANGGWDVFDSYKVGAQMNLQGAPVEIVGLKTSYDKGDIDVEGYYGESALPQGSEFETYIVFKIGDLFYKKTGRGDSYGEVVWSGNIKQVEAVQKTIWEFK